MATTNLRRRVLGAALCAGALPWAPARLARAEEPYPARPLRLLNGFPAGGATDAAARLIAQRLEARLGEKVLVENVTGAAGTIAATQVARAAPDGHVLLFGVAANLAVAPALKRQPPYDPAADFTPVIELATGPYYWFVRGDGSLRSMPEFIDLARREPGRLNYGSPGIGSVHHLATEMLQRRTGISLVHVPYRGLLVPALLADEVQGGFETMTGLAPVVANGRLRPLAVTGPRRQPTTPEVPTLDELGIGGIDVRSWWGIVGPKGLPGPVVSRLHGELAAILAEPGIRAGFAQWSVVEGGGSPADFGAHIRRESARWRDEIDRIGLERQ